MVPGYEITIAVQIKLNIKNAPLYHSILNFKLEHYTPTLRCSYDSEKHSLYNIPSHTPFPKAKEIATMNKDIAFHHMYVCVRYSNGVIKKECVKLGYLEQSCIENCTSNTSSIPPWLYLFRTLWCQSESRELQDGPVDYVTHP
ncbi:hypothetical protein PIB30_068128 [Stylosanthes scabra]|uniref:Uncharacterized protein n=1 Tax=Stylosanthes scabra TaxID=79078 RepID=A0ABU6VLB7_9FABA|nr:hypothetical protein [Stylosanthes scabra]